MSVRQLTIWKLRSRTSPSFCACCL